MALLKYFKPLIVTGELPDPKVILSTRQQIIEVHWVVGNTFPQVYYSTSASININWLTPFVKSLGHKNWNYKLLCSTHFVKQS